MDVGDRHGNGQDGTHRRHDGTKKPGSFGGPSYDILIKNIGFHWKRNKNRSEFYQNLMKIDLWHRQGRFESEELQSRNLDESSQAMLIPGTGGKAAEGTFRWKRSTFERHWWYFEKSCSTEVVKCRVFQIQDALFERCTFQMWRARRPQAKKTGRWKLENGNVALSQGEVVFGQ